MKAASLHPQPGVAAAAPDVAAGRAARRPRAARRERRPWTVKATLRAAFAILLVGTLAIGVFSLWQISRLNASIASVYEQGGRPDLVETEQQELDVISTFLPAELSEDELGELVRAAIAEQDAAGPGDLGKVMRPLMQRVAGRADGGRVNALVRELLAGGG